MSRGEQPKIRAYARVATREQLTGISRATENGKAYVYARVCGTDLAPLTNDALEAQQDRLLDCAKTLRLEVVSQEAELARWGITENARQKLLEAAASGKIGTLVVAGCSRLHRNSAKAIDLLSELDRYGVRIYSQQEGWINISEDGQPTMLQFLQLMHPHDRKEGALNELS